MLIPVTGKSNEVASLDTACPQRLSESVCALSQVFEAQSHATCGDGDGIWRCSDLAANQYLDAQPLFQCYCGRVERCKQ
ncbi:hypothetical protein A8M77_27210 [Variovorax sp. JS1663]|nr:hypothetical protein A8M77_27210 [Variovorax sp. JS1663]